jgi:hypothetical protein
MIAGEAWPVQRSIEPLPAARAWLVICRSPCAVLDRVRRALQLQIEPSAMIADEAWPVQMIIDTQACRGRARLATGLAYC